MTLRTGALAGELAMAASESIDTLLVRPGSPEVLGKSSVLFELGVVGGDVVDVVVVVVAASGVVVVVMTGGVVVLLVLALALALALAVPGGTTWADAAEEELEARAVSGTPAAAI